MDVPIRVISLIDIRANGPRQLMRDHGERAKDLISASRKTFGLFSEIIGHLLLPYGDRLSRNWLIKTNNPYLDEIDFYADHLGVPGVHALNICFEWGCTSAVYAKEDGPTLARVMDWRFPKLGHHMIVAHQNGRLGIFTTSPGRASAGCFTAWRRGGLRPHLIRHRCSAIDARLSAIG